MSIPSLSFALALVAGALTGCSAYVSQGIDDQDRAQEVVFPEIPDQATLPEGTFPRQENLRLVSAGMSKDQLYDLLGRPHFQEGLFGVREWDYVFNFRDASGVTTCQYKVIFDKDFLARSFHWKPESCATQLAKAAPAN